MYASVGFLSIDTVGDPCSRLSNLFQDTLFFKVSYYVRCFCFFCYMHRCGWAWIGVTLGLMLMCKGGPKDNREKNPYFAWRILLLRSPTSLRASLDGFFLFILTHVKDEKEEHVQLASTSTNCLKQSWSQTVFNPPASSWLAVPFVPRIITSWPWTTPCSVSIITKVKLNSG